MYCVYLGKAVQTVNPPSGSVGNSQVASTIITGQTAETSIATDDTVLIHDTSAGALRKMTRANFVSGVGGTNECRWFASVTNDQTISHASLTKVAFANEVIDSASNTNTKSQSTDNTFSDETDTLNQNSNNRTRAIREDPVAYVNNSLVKLNEGKKRLEDRLFEQKVLITQLERRKDTDLKTLDRHNKNLSTWKNAYQNKEFNKKVKTAKQLLKSGHTKMETQRIINKKFKLNRAENASTGRYVRVASSLLDK